MRYLRESGWNFDSLSDTPAFRYENSTPSKIQWDPFAQVPLNRFLSSNLVDAYFVHYHTVYPIVHEGLFRAQWTDISPKTTGIEWSFLFRTIVAIGAWCIGCQLTGPQDEDVLMSQDLGVAVFCSGNLYMVQALALLATYLHKQDRPNTAWNYLGLATRIAISLGLHKEFPQWNISPLQREIRRRVWWMLYMFDNGASMMFGRPVLLPARDVIGIEQPHNLSDEVCHQTYPCFSNVLTISIDSHSVNHSPTH